MNGLVCRFAVLTDPHITTPETHRHYAHRLHRLEYSIPILEAALARLSQQPLDFLLIPGDLTQHGEPENHTWLSKRLGQLPFPSYVIPGNHDIPPRPRGDPSDGISHLLSSARLSEYGGIVLRSGNFARFGFDRLKFQPIYP